jgi:hypothetical protein
MLQVSMARAPHWTKSRITVAISLRVLLVTVLLSLLSFAVGLATGLFIAGIKTALGHSHAYAAVYRSFGVPAAFVGMFAGLVSMLIIELRQWRRPRIPPTLH